jgi:integration host factor subunit beta
MSGLSRLSAQAAPGGTLTKSELIEVVAQEAGLPKGRAEMVINTIFDSMVEALQRGEGIEIRGFGSFTVRQYKSYEGRNPRTGEPVHVAPKRLPFFKVGKDLRERVNGNPGEAGVARRREPQKPQSTAVPSPAKPTPRADPGMTEDVI